MAVTTTPLSNPVGANIVLDTDSDATGENDVRSGATTIFIVDVDNTLVGAVTYTKLYNALAPTIGTTAPDVILRTPASVRRVFVLGLEGVNFPTGLSFASVTAAGTAGTTSPTADVTVRILTS